MTEDLFQPRCAILGNAGSGKTTLAKKIQSQTQAPILDLDNVTWQRGQIQKRREISESLEEVAAFITSSSQAWIVEGCYGELIESTLRHEPLLIFLDPGEAICLDHCRNRPWESHKYSSKTEQDKLLQFLLSWVSEYYRRDGPMSHQYHQHLFDSYPGPKLKILNSY